MRRLYEEPVAGAPLLPRFPHKTFQSAAFFGPGGPKKIADALRGRDSPKVAIVGGSRNAITTAYLCLHDNSGIPFGSESVTVLYRKDFRLTYNSPAEALADGYDAFGPSDICLKTGRVFPCAGFRTYQRDLVRRHWGLGGLEPDNRLRLLRLKEDRYAEANDVLERADLIVAALGYRPRALPLFSDNQTPLRLFSEDGENPMVDKDSRVLDVAGRPIPGVFALGSADGYPYAAGGHCEPSFAGQANSLPLWQSDIGEGVISQLIAMARLERLATAELVKTRSSVERLS